MSPRIANTSEIPDVTPDFHTLRVEEVELVDGYKYGEPETPETRVKMLLRVVTPGHEEVSFFAFMSQASGEKATLGSIVRATLGEFPRGELDTDDLIGKTFRMMTTTNDGGWPKLVAGTAAPATAGRMPKRKPAAELNPAEMVEPPF